MALSADGTVVARGAYLNDGGGSNSGHVRVHAWNDATNQWDQRGQDIDGEGDNDYSAQYPIDLSDDGTVVAIGAHANSPPGKAGAGHARVFAWSATATPARSCLLYTSPSPRD